MYIHQPIIKENCVYIVYHSVLLSVNERNFNKSIYAQAGQLLNVVFGADAPRLARTIEQELHNEELARRGERERPRRAPHELTPPEQVAQHSLN